MNCITFFCKLAFFLWPIIKRDLNGGSVLCRKILGVHVNSCEEGGDDFSFVLFFFSARTIEFVRIKKPLFFCSLVLRYTYLTVLTIKLGIIKKKLCTTKS